MRAWAYVQKKKVPGQDSENNYPKGKTGRKGRTGRGADYKWGERKRRGRNRRGNRVKGKFGGKAGHVLVNPCGGYISRT